MAALPPYVSSRWAVHPCACSFAKEVGDKDPRHFPRVGMADNALYRGGWIVRHSGSGKEAIIRDLNRPTLHAEADKCCFGYFEVPA